MKRWHCVYLIVPVILMGLVISWLLCFATASAQSSITTPSNEAQDTTQPVTIRLWHAYTGDGEDRLNEFVSEFESTYPTITVQVENHYPSVTLFNDVMRAIKSGAETPNITFGYPNQMWNYARFDALRFVDDFVGDPDIGIDTTDFYTAALGENSLAEYEYQLGGLPIGQSAGEILFYNADMLVANGITVPQTWDEFYTACVSLTTETVSGTILRTNYTQFVSLIWTRGGEPYSPDLKRARFNDGHGIDSLRLYRDLIDGGYARMAAYPYEEQAVFANGQAAFIMGASTSIPYIRAAIDGAGVVNLWGVASLPAVPGHEATMEAGRSIMIMRGTEPEEQAAWLFLRWFTQREQNARFAAQSGYYPVRISASTHPSITEKLNNDPQYAQALQLLGEEGRNQTLLLAMLDIYTEMRDAVEAILYDGQPITETLDAAAANVDAILALTGPDAATISPWGGVLVYTNTQGLTATAVFPPGALTVTETVAYVPLSDLPADGLSFALVPNLVLSRPVTLTMSYRDQDVAGMDEDLLKLYNYDWAGNTWVDANPCGGYIRDPLNNKLTAIVCHFSDHALVDRPYRMYLPLIFRSFEQ